MSAAAFLVILVILHGIKPEIDPSWQTTSEYAIGENGWIMVMAFLISAVSFATLVVAIKSQIKTWYGKTGLVLLVLTAVATAVAGIFVTDPIETPQNALSTSGMIHGLGGALALLFLPFAALLINVSLLRKNPDWKSVRGILLWTLGLPLLGLIGFFVAQAMLVPSDGHFGPGVNIGWPDRMLTVIYSLWVIIMARTAIKVRTWK